MTAARIAALALALTIPDLFAQATHPTALKIQVVDQSGAIIPDASIQVRTEANTLAAEVHANGQGEAELSLDPGRYTVSIKALGFRSWQTSIELPYKSGRPIRAELIIGCMCPPCPMIVDDTQQFRLERLVPAASITLEPVAALVLPARKVRSRH